MTTTTIKTTAAKQLHFAVFFGVVLDAVAASVAVKLLLRPFFFVKCSSAFHTKRTKMPRKIPTCANASGWGVSCCMVEWVTASASRAYHALFAYVQAEGIWCHLAIISIRHSLSGFSRGKGAGKFTHLHWRKCCWCSMHKRLPSVEVVVVVIAVGVAPVVVEAVRLMMVPGQSVRVFP